VNWLTSNERQGAWASAADFDDESLRPVFNHLIFALIDAADLTSIAGDIAFVVEINRPMIVQPLG